MAQFVSNRGLQWHYELSGKGDPIVFIHGFAGSSRWWGQQKAFFESDHYQVLSLDLPGHGQSSWSMVNLVGMAEDIRDLLAELNLTQINIVASSFGGLIAFELYRLIPEQISRMSLVGSIAKFARNDRYPAGLDIINIRQMSQQFQGDYASILDIFFRSLFSRKERELQAFKNLKELRQRESLPQREALLAFLDILEKADLRDRLSSIVCPVQLITGTEDYLCPQAVMEWTQEHMQNARLDFIDEAGHLPFLTRVKEYNELLENFLIN